MLLSAATHLPWRVAPDVFASRASSGCSTVSLSDRTMFDGANRQAASASETLPFQARHARTCADRSACRARPCECWRQRGLTPALRPQCAVTQGEDLLVALM